jgi:hypothetical protein
VISLKCEEKEKCENLHKMNVSDVESKLSGSELEQPKSEKEKKREVNAFSKFSTKNLFLIFVCFRQ